MGRRSKVKHVVPNAGQEKIVSKSEQDLLNLTDQLLKICSKVAPVGGQLLEELKEIATIIEQIRFIENAGSPLPTGDRANNFSTFMQWLKDSGLNVDKVSINQFVAGDWGLKMESDLKEGEIWLTVPRKVMLCSDKFPQTTLGNFLKADPISQNLAHIALALFLLEERFDPESSWKPYFDILPSSYDTVLYYSLEEMELLKGSVTLEESLKQCRHIARQYAYYWQMFQRNEESSKLNLKGKFTFDTYRWAVSTIMTRQNTVPTADGATMCRALVPLWDMCNHCSGQLATDYDLVKDVVQSYAIRNFSKGEQLFIAYGNRSNAEFFVHNAFVDDDNPFDSVNLKLGIGKNDPLGTKKTELLDGIGINRNTPMTVTLKFPPIANHLLAFIRVFVMLEDDLDVWLSKPVTDVSQLLNERCDSLSSIVESKAWKFLSIRLGLLLAAFSTTLAADEALLAEEESALSPRARTAIRMRLSEKKVLRRSLDYAESRL